MISDQIARDAVEIESLTATDNGQWQFVYLSGGENEDHARRRLFERLQQGIKRGRRKHVHFVHDIHFVPVAWWWGDLCPFHNQLTNLVDLRVRRGVVFEHAERVPAGDLPAWIANSARGNRRTFHAIQGLCQNARRRSFAGSAGTDEEIGVRQPVLLDRVFERPRHVGLPDEIVERLRTILSRENLIAHTLNLIRFNRARKQKTKITMQAPWLAATLFLPLSVGR